MGEKYHVVSVIGDGALTGGMAYEALNNAAELKTNFIIIINDNNMSISKNVGGMSTYLSALRTAETYTGMKIGVTKTLKKIPHVGTAVVDTVRKTKSTISDHGNHMVFLSHQVSGTDIAKSCGNGIGTVSGIKRITVTFIPFWKTA